METQIKLVESLLKKKDKKFMMLYARMYGKTTLFEAMKKVRKKEK